MRMDTLTKINQTANIPRTILWKGLKYWVLYPTVTMEETDGLGSSQFIIPFAFAISTVHPISLYHEREWTDWDHTKLFHLVFGRE